MSAHSAGPSNRRAVSDDDDDPLRSKRQRLLEEQAHLVEIERITTRLRQLQTADGAMVPIVNELAFVRGHMTTKTALVDAASDYARLAGSSATPTDGKVSVPIDVLLPHLKQEQVQWEQRVATSRDEVMQLAREYFSQHITDHGSGPDSEVKMDRDGQALNEEGLPFVDLTEPLQDDEVSRSRGVVQPFEPARKQTREERRAWMDSVLAQLEREEARGDRDVVAVQDNAASSEEQQTKHRRVTSADRPLPVKSVLKPTSAGTPQRFGASGMRRGFLNMNPSSPAAEHSSDPIEALRLTSQDDSRMSSSTSSLGSMAEHLNGSSGDGPSDRMSRSTELTQTGPLQTPKKKKKTVRIQSPEGVRQRRPSARDALLEPLRDAKAARKPTDGEEDTRSEAEQIVSLLGIDAIKGHPQYEALKESAVAQEEANQQHRAAVAAASSASAKRKLPEGPAVRRDVVERPALSQQLSLPQSTKVPASAFKRGFMNVKPKQPVKRVSALPAGPQTSLGISALERATNNDETLSDERVKQGLTPAVPHARPSKAYAAKLEAKKRGGEATAANAEEDADEELPVRMSKVRFGTDSNGSVAVKVGEAATSATNSSKVYTPDPDLNEGIVDEDIDMQSDEDDLEAMGLEVHDEELDDEQVDALGYFSDEDDPDIGFDSDDLVEAVPLFDSDATDINNADLRREYERIKAQLTQSGALSLAATRRRGQDGDDNAGDSDVDEEMALRDGRDLSMADDDGEANDKDAAMSQFRRERLHRAMLGRKNVSHELSTNAGRSEAADAGTLNGAQNVGPSMLIPTLANVRYPKPTAEDGSVPTRAHEIELGGQSDDEEDRLEDVMRARLAQKDIDLAAAPVTEPSARPRATDAPPSIRATSASSAAKPVKKASLFKSRMQGNVPDE